MKLHLYTNKTELYSFDSFVNIMDDDEFISLCDKEGVESILNSDNINELLDDFNWSDLISAIDTLFDKSNNGEFDWADKTGEYYELFNKMLSHLTCDLITNDNIILKSYQCKLSERHHEFIDSLYYVSLTNFYSGNGEPIGAQLALEMADLFMRTGKWHVGLFDSNNNLITNIYSWAKEHILDIINIKPIIWFGSPNYIPECWSITPDSSDLFVHHFWGDYYDGALPYICKDRDDIYYSIWEYGLDFDPTIFDEIKSSCPINLGLSNEDRTKALYKLIISMYNESKSEEFTTEHLNKEV